MHEANADGGTWDVSNRPIKFQEPIGAMGVVRFFFCLKIKPCNHVTTAEGPGEERPLVSAEIIGRDWSYRGNLIVQNPQNMQSLNYTF